MGEGAGQFPAAGTRPERIGRYRIVDQIGRGGMAVVYRAVLDGPCGFAKEVCLKRILPGSSTDPAMVEMFEREARLAALLQHTNVVQVFDFDIHEGSPFLVMELVDGPSLWEVFNEAVRRRQPVPIPVATGIAVQALQGLHHVHTRTLNGKSMGLVHRDVSLHNILVARSGEVKVADFGIARATELGERTRTGVLKGKLAYIAPEYAATGKADHRGDLFSTGVVLHELLAGRRRMPAGTEAEGLAWVLHARFEPLVELRPDVPDVLAAVVAALTAALPGDRPADAAEAAARLAAAVVPAEPAEVARFVEAIAPRGDARRREPTLVAASGAPGDTVPTPSPFDPTVTRCSTDAAGASGSGPRVELTPDGSTTLADVGAPRRAARFRRAGRRLLAASVGLFVVLAGVALWLFGPWGGRAEESSSRAPAAAAGAGAEPGPSGSVPGPAARIVPASRAGDPTGRQQEPVPAGPLGVESAAAPPGAGPSLPPSSSSPGSGALAPASATVGASGTVAAAPAADVGAAVPSVREPARPTVGREAVAEPRVAPAVPLRASVRSDDGSATGLLHVFVLPWAYVSIDGEAPREAQVLHREVSAGRHRIVLEQPALSCRLEVTESVPAAGEVTVRRNLNEHCGGLRDVTGVDASDR